MKNAASTDEKNGISWFYRNTKTNAKGNFAKLLQSSCSTGRILRLLPTAGSTLPSPWHCRECGRKPPCSSSHWYHLHARNNKFFQFRALISQIIGSILNGSWLVRDRGDAARVFNSRAYRNAGTAALSPCAARPSLPHPLAAGLWPHTFLMS